MAERRPCGHCQATGIHARWCPSVDVDEAFERGARAGGYRTTRDAFDDGYALGLLHAGMQPAAGMIERALVVLSPGDLARLARRIAGPRPSVEITAQPNEREVSRG